jgi:hypothetical protein
MALRIIDISFQEPTLKFCHTVFVIDDANDMGNEVIGLGYNVL